MLTVRPSDLLRQSTTTVGITIKTALAEEVLFDLVGLISA
jgi:hypothetical protein